MAENAVVEVGKFEDIDRALRTLKKELSKDSFWQDLRRHQEYLPPSVRKRNKSARARRKVLTNLKRREATEARFENVKFTRRVRGPVHTLKGTE